MYVYPLSNHVKKVVTDLLIHLERLIVRYSSKSFFSDKKIFIGSKINCFMITNIVSLHPSKNIDDVKPQSENVEIYINPHVIIIVLLSKNVKIEFAQYTNKLRISKII